MNQEGKNQRPRMAELSRNEEKSNENHKYQGCIFKQDNSDDNFNPEENNIKDSEDQEQERERVSNIKKITKTPMRNRRKL